MRYTQPLRNYAAHHAQVVAVLATQVIQVCTELNDDAMKVETYNFVIYIYDNTQKNFRMNGNATVDHQIS